MKKLLCISLVLFMCVNLFPAGILAGSFGAHNEVEPYRVNNGIEIDTDPDGGYAGDYVVIYNPAETHSSATDYSTGNLSGLIETQLSSASDSPEDALRLNDLPMIIDIDGMLQEENAKKTPAQSPEYLLSVEGTRALSFNVGDKRNFSINSTYSPTGSSTVQFKLLAKGAHCYIWTPTSTAANVHPLDAIDSSYAQTAADEFDSKFDIMQSSFGNHYNGASGDGRVNILFYNINDGWTSGNGYTDGFFSNLDYYNNEMPILNIDTYPAIDNPDYDEPELSRIFGTMVHEYQHMIHYSRVYVTGGFVPTTWINECMSAAAEELCYPGSNLITRLRSWTNKYVYTTNELVNPPEYFEYNADCLIHKGYSMYEWNNTSDTYESQTFTMDDTLTLYARTCLFSQYIYSRHGDEFFSQLLTKLAQGKTFQAAYKELTGTNASDFVGDFRTALVANTTEDVLDGIYSFSMHPGYDPSSYYGIENPYSLLGPIVYTGTGPEKICAGGAIVVKPVGGVFNPPSNASANLKYYGITLANTIPDIPTDGEMVVEKTVTLQSDGTYDFSLSAYSTGAECDANSVLRDFFSIENFRLPSGSVTYRTELISCTGLNSDGTLKFASVGEAYPSGVTIKLYTNNYYVTGFDYGANACAATGIFATGKKLVVTLKGLTLCRSDLVGEISTDNARGSGIFTSADAISPSYACDPVSVYVRPIRVPYDYGTTLDYFEEDATFVSLDSGYNKQSSSTTVFSPDSGEYSVTANASKLEFTVKSIMGEASELNALLQLPDDSYEWSLVSFVPATNVLYEDQLASGESFMTFTDGIASWSSSGTFDSAKQSGINRIYGYDASYSDDTRDSHGTAMSTTVTNTMYTEIRDHLTDETWPTVIFSFTGTGLDLISRTGADTGILVINIVPKGEPFTYKGSGNDNAHAIVDTYYSGDAGDTLYQIPVFHFDGLDHGEYDVLISAVYMPYFDLQTNGVDAARLIPGVPENDYDFIIASPESANARSTRTHGSFTSYIDAVRIYEPIAGGTNEPAYLEANDGTGEANPTYVQVRSLVEAAGASSALNLILDESAETPVAAAEYLDNSPNNEVYIRKNGSVAFNVGGDYAGVHLSLKSPTGEYVTVKINGTALCTVNHATELYYDITDLIGANGEVSVTCTAVSGEPILSLVNVKLIPASDGTNSAPEIFVSDALLQYVEAVNFGVMGDANHDGALSILDAVAALRYALKLNTLDAYGIYCADMNGDGRIEVIDAMLVMRSALKLN